MQKIKKGDTVQVIAGRDKGKRGKVLEVLPEEGKVRVEGIAIQKRHLKAGARQSLPQGGILDRPGKIHISNVRFYSEQAGRGVRSGFEQTGDGGKVRVARGKKAAGTRLD